MLRFLHFCVSFLACMLFVSVLFFFSLFCVLVAAGLQGAGAPAATRASPCRRRGGCRPPAPSAGSSASPDLDSEDGSHRRYPRRVATPRGLRLPSGVPHAAATTCPTRRPARRYFSVFATLQPHSVQGWQMKTTATPVPPIQCCPQKTSPFRSASFRQYSRSKALGFAATLMRGEGGSAVVWTCEACTVYAQEC